MGLARTTLPGFIRPSGSQMSLNSLECSDDGVPEHPGQQFRARLSIAVLTRERSAVSDDQVSGLVQEGAECLEPLGAGQFEINPAMQQPCPKWPYMSA